MYMRLTEKTEKLSKLISKSQVIFQKQYQPTKATN